MLFSAAVDDASPGGALAFLSRPDVLNVAITRAKRLQVVFVSRAPERFDPTSLFGRYLEWVVSCAGSRDGGRDGVAAVARDAPSSPAGPPTDTVVRVSATRWPSSPAAPAARVELDVRVGRIAVDVVLRCDGGVACVDVVGPGAHALRLDEHDVLRRAGVDVLVVTVEDDPDATERRVRALARELTIRGGGAWLTRTPRPARGLVPDARGAEWGRGAGAIVRRDRGRRAPRRLWSPRGPDSAPRRARRSSAPCRTTRCTARSGPSRWRTGRRCARCSTARGGAGTGRRSGGRDDRRGDGRAARGDQRARARLGGPARARDGAAAHAPGREASGSAAERRPPASLDRVARPRQSVPGCVGSPSSSS